MSFSSNIKNEILNIVKDKHCNIAEICSIINYCGKTNKKGQQNKEQDILIIQADNELPLIKISELISNTLKKETKIQKKEGKTYKIVLKDKKFIKNLFNIMKNYKEDTRYCNLSILDDICCKRAYIRGAFICNGYISNPQKSYHIEFTNQSLEQAEILKKLINEFNICSKIIEKKGNFIVYIKESEQIVELLNIIEAHKALLELENIRILKDVRNNVNRIVNCETANLNKVVSTGVLQKQNIEYIEKTIGLKNLPVQLIEIAKLRLENPDVSLQELSEMLSIKISKSGINHRLKKINKIAKELRER